MQTPIGTIIAWANVIESMSIPDGWVECDGATHQLEDEVSVTVPDLRGVFLRGADAQFPPMTRGGSDDIAAHSHGVNLGGVPVLIDRPNDIAQSGGVFGGNPLHHPSVIHSHNARVSDTTVNTTQNAAQDNRPRFVSVRFIIRIR